MPALDTSYAEAKAAMLGTIGGPESKNWSLPVPATPEWTVRDVVAHVTGIAVDAANGRLPADLNLLEQFRDDNVIQARNEFADGHVLRREGRSPTELANEWDAAEPEVLDRLRRSPGEEGALPFPFDAVMVTDLCVHTDDVAGALGLPPKRDLDGSRVGLAAYAFGVDYRIRTLGLPALTLRYDGKEKTLGEGPANAVLIADRWEMFRVLAGRRSRQQILGLPWEGDPTPYLELLPAYGEREDALIEG